MSNPSSYKHPPVLSDGIQYETWVKELNLWSLCCKLDKKEQGPAVALSLSGNAGQSALDIDVETLNSDGGLQAVINKLNGLYLKDVNQRIYVAMKNFEQYKRPPNTSIDNYLTEFDIRYNRLKAHSIQLPDAVLAYRLLESANLEQSKSELVRATINNMSFTEMKAQLRKLEDSAVIVGDDGNFMIKNEPEDVSYNRSFERGGRGGRGGGRGGRGGFHGSQRGGRSNYNNYNNSYSNNNNQNYNNYNNSNNDFNNDNNYNNYYSGRGRGRSRGRGRGACFVCSSLEHQVRDCPERNNPEQDVSRRNASSDTNGNNRDVADVEIVDVEV